jgi:hypothetical protein
MKMKAALLVCAAAGLAFLPAVELINWNMSNWKFAKLCRDEPRLRIHNDKAWRNWSEFAGPIYENYYREVAKFHRELKPQQARDKAWELDRVVSKQIASYQKANDIRGTLTQGRRWGWPYAGIWTIRHQVYDKEGLVAEYYIESSGTFFLPWFLPATDSAGLDRSCILDKRYPKMTAGMRLSLFPPDVSGVWKGNRN